MALSYANICVKEHEIDLKNKPIEFIKLSPKASVPVLVLENGLVIEQSLDIIKWALRQSDPDKWLIKELEAESDKLIYLNDYQFKPILDNYKYTSGVELQTLIYYREQAEPYLGQLNKLLMQQHYLLANHITFADIAIFPFIRQFCMVDKQWFMKSEYTFLINWLNYFLESALFLRVMIKSA